MWVWWLTSENFGWSQGTGRFSYCVVAKEESSILSLTDGGVRKVAAMRIELVVDPLWDLQVALTWRHQMRATQGLRHCCWGQGESRGNWGVLKERGTSADPDPALGCPSLSDAKTLASEFPGWTLAFGSQDESLAAMLSVTHPVWVCSSALWDAVASTTENTAGAVSYLNAFTSLGEA